MIKFLKKLRNQKNQSNMKSPILKNAIIILNRQQKVLNAFESGIFLK